MGIFGRAFLWGMIHTFFGRGL